MFWKVSGTHSVAPLHAITTVIQRMAIRVNRAAMPQDAFDPWSQFF